MSTSTANTNTPTPPPKEKPTVLLILSEARTPEPDLPPPQWARLQNLFHFLHYDCASPTTFLSRLRAPGPYAHIAAIVRTGWLKAGPWADQKLFTAAMVPHFPASLQLICCGGHGHDAVDVRALAERGVAYCNAPDTCTEAVANTALYLILASYRFFSFAERCARAGPGDAEYRWQRSREIGNVAADPVGQVLGIVGLGAIGLAIARKAAAALGVKVHYYNRRRLSPEVEASVPESAELQYHGSLDELLAVADCICLACPLTDATRHLLSAPQFAKMKSEGVRIVNIARGGLIDEDALLEAMDTGRVIGVGLDVHADEPGVNPKLRDNYMTTVLPHIGVASKTSWRNFDQVCFDNLEEWFYGDKSKVTIVKP